MNSSLVSQQAAAKELLRRRRARTSLVDFSRYTHDGYIPTDHHFQIAEKLEAVARGEIKRLMIFMPPRHGKSELASRRFPAWYLGNYPERSIIAASYNSDLAGDFGRDVRNIINATEYKSLFNVALAEDSRAAGRWHTDKGGGYVAAGVGTAITGRGAHILLIDDPFKDRESADSEIIREKTYKWYLSTAYTRLEGSITEQDPDDLWRETTVDADPFEGGIVIIQTRWHEDDLAGRLLLDMKNGADQFDVLSLPAIDKAGKALWPGKYPIARLQQIKKALPNRDWEALYQQEPTPDEGILFKRGWFKRFRLGDEPTCTNYLSSDYAVTKDDGDYTELSIWGVDAADDLYARAWWSGQETSDVWIETALDLIQKHQPSAALGETGVIRRAIEPQLNKRSRERQVYFRQVWITRSGDKVAMARPFQARASMGKVYIPYGEWGDRVINQLCAFPAGTYDDAVDNCSLIGLHLDATYSPGTNESETTKKKDPYGFDEEDVDNWKTS